MSTLTTENQTTSTLYEHQMEFICDPGTRVCPLNLTIADKVVTPSCLYQNTTSFDESVSSHIRKTCTAFLGTSVDDIKDLLV